MSADGIHEMVAYKDMPESVRKMRDFYSIKPDAPIYQQEFGFYCLDRWREEGHTERNLGELFGYDRPGKYCITDLGWCEPEFYPRFPEKVLEDRGERELVQDYAGRSVLCFKNRRQGFMPEYVDNPVVDMKTWNERCKWRLDPQNPERYKDQDKKMARAIKAAGEGQVICQKIVGGYMYLRALIGPLKLMYLLYDDPKLIHECMKAWFELADAVTARNQQYVTYDEVFIAEDICYNHASLISHDMIKEFLFPYYQQLLTNIRKRQIDKSRRLYFQVDTDGYLNDVLDLYRDNVGIDYISPFEVASGCDVVETGKKYPDLLMLGGIDKRILAQGKEAIDRELDRIMPVMRKRGGYIPTCDHGVPEEVSFENYMHYRKRMLEYSK